MDSPNKGPVIWDALKFIRHHCNGTFPLSFMIASPLMRQGNHDITSCYLHWRHNERGGVSNHQPNDCLLNRLFRRRSKKTSKLRVTGLCAGNSPVTGEFPAQRASNAENVSIWWRHHVERSNPGHGEYRSYQTIWHCNQLFHTLDIGRSQLTHCGLVRLYSDIDLGQHWLHIF